MQKILKLRLKDLNDIRKEKCNYFGCKNEALSLFNKKPMCSFCYNKSKTELKTKRNKERIERKSMKNIQAFKK